LSAAKHILVVDDDATIRELIELALTDEGYEIIAARNGAEALAVVGAAPVDLILLDIRMPIMDGWTFARTYRDLPGPHAPIIVLTASRGTGEGAADVAVAAFLAKPFEIAPLLAAVAHALTSHGPGTASS